MAESTCEKATVQRDTKWWNCIKRIETPFIGERQQESEFIPGAMDSIVETWPDGIDYIRRMRIEPGDVLVLFSDRSLTTKEQQSIGEQMHAAFPDNGLLILHGGLHLGVLGADS